jgi:DNA repair protein RecO (recombination protein O)
MKKAIDGLILRETPIGESDKLLTVLTAEGQMMMTAKGARSMKSKVMPLCRLFTYANLEYYEKNDRRWLSGGSVNDSFFGLNSDIEGFALAAYLMQVAAEITGEGVDATDVLRMTLNALYCIEKKQKPYAQIKGVYELFAACVSGFAPDLSGCGECGCEEHGEMWLDVMNGQLLCGDCLKKRAGNLPLPEFDAYSTRNILLPLDPSTLASMRYVCGASLSRIFAFSLHSEESLACFAKATEGYLLHHLERGFDTLDFYRTVQ